MLKLMLRYFGQCKWYILHTVQIMYHSTAALKRIESPERFYFLKNLLSLSSNIFLKFSKKPQQYLLWHRLQKSGIFAMLKINLVVYSTTFSNSLKPDRKPRLRRFVIYLSWKLLIYFTIISLFVNNASCNCSSHFSTRETTLRSYLQLPC